ncbi:MAG: DUF2695 domain-containing protein [Patescibacteria group bacterium]|jgi:hypothetical protein
MNFDNPQWDDFLDRLYGPEGCNFQYDADGKPTWVCKAGNDKTYATLILQDMGLSKEEIIKSCEFFDENGGHCDCEIIWNVARHNPNCFDNETSNE